jgi:hypothetical protein
MAGMRRPAALRVKMKMRVRLQGNRWASWASGLRDRR